MPSQLSRENRAAVEFAREAGEALAELRSGSMLGRALGRQGDELSHHILINRLLDRFPDDRIRSEESDAPASFPADQSDRASGRVWIVDPLDGTREYGEGRADWAVHVGLAIGGEPLVGAVALPSQEVMLGTGSPPPLAEPASPPRMVVSRSRPPKFALIVAQNLGATTAPMGSAGAKIAAVIRGEAEIYLHAGGQYEWDSAAPIAVALASGLHASRLDGSPLRYSQPDPWLPDLVVCHPTLAETVMEGLGEVNRWVPE